MMSVALIKYQDEVYNEWHFDQMSSPTITFACLN